MNRHQPPRLHAVGEGPQIDGRSMATGVKVGGSSSAIIEPILNQPAVIILEVAGPVLDHPAQYPAWVDDSDINRNGPR